MLRSTEGSSSHFLVCRWFLKQFEKNEEGLASTDGKESGAELVGSAPRVEQGEEYPTQWRDGMTPGAKRSERSVALAASPRKGEFPPFARTWKISCMVRRSDEWVKSTGLA